MNGPGGIGGFIDRLFCEPENMRFLCKKCHKLVTLAERKGCSLKEAEIHQKTIAFSKFSVSMQKNLLKMWEVDEKQWANAQTRRAAAERFYRQELAYEDN
jgi:hypothetical protein